MAFEGHEPMAHMSPKKAGSRRSATQQAHLFLNVLETPSKQCGVTTARNTPRVLAGENTQTFLRSSFPFLERNIRADHIFLRPGPSKCTLVSRFCWPGPAHHIWPYLAISGHISPSMVDHGRPAQSDRIDGTNPVTLRQGCLYQSFLLCCLKMGMGTFTYTPAMTALPGSSSP